MTDPTGSDLVKTGDTPEAFTGAGIADTIVSAFENIQKDWADGGQFDAVTAGVGVAAVGLDAISAIANPFKAAVTAGVGWILEHWDLPREALDKITGDPQAIKSLVQSWANIRNELANTPAASSAEVPGWTGKAAESHQKLADSVKKAADGTAALAGSLAASVEQMGVIVATIRSLVVDIIAEAIGAAIVWAAGALAAAAPTAGGSIVAAVARIIQLVASVMGKIAKLLDKLAEALGVMKGLLKQLGNAAENAGSTLTRKAGELGERGDELTWKGQEARAKGQIFKNNAVDAYDWDYRPSNWRNEPEPAADAADGADPPVDDRSAWQKTRDWADTASDNPVHEVAETFGKSFNDVLPSDRPETEEEREERKAEEAEG